MLWIESDRRSKGIILSCQNHTYPKSDYRCVSARMRLVTIAVDLDMQIVTRLQHISDSQSYT